MSLFDVINATLATKIADALGKYHKGFFTKRVLKTTEEVEANTNPKNLPSALVVGELINDLTAMTDSGAIKGLDAREDGVYITYVPSPGADPVVKKLGESNFEVVLQIKYGLYDQNKNVWRETTTATAKITCIDKKCTVQLTNAGNLYYGAYDSVTHVRVQSVAVSSITFN